MLRPPKLPNDVYVCQCPLTVSPCPFLWWIAAVQSSSVFVSVKSTVVPSAPVPFSQSPTKRLLVTRWGLAGWLRSFSKGHCARERVRHRLSGAGAPLKRKGAPPFPDGKSVYAPTMQHMMPRFTYLRLIVTPNVWRATGGHDRNKDEHAEAEELVQQMLVAEPGERLSAAGVCTHKWCRGQAE